MQRILEVKELTIKIAHTNILQEVSLSLYQGRISALVGESGSGKSMTAFSLINLLPQTAEIVSGDVLYDGKSVFKLNEKEKKHLRGGKISIVFQEPFSALNPVIKVGEQLEEVIKIHLGKTRREARIYAKKILKDVKLSEEIFNKYPHELSGGMCQRVVIAMGISLKPNVLVLDEPTSSLDVSIQRDILDLIVELKNKYNFATLFITHDFSVLKIIADDVYVMKDGCIVEYGETSKVLSNPENEYTKKLIKSVPRIGDKRSRL